ncbi:MAG: aminotransferase class V-fold PLP-dependent enzyme [Caldilinea sp. CFX5]|nr:aminotransferase class V-fold PLP-dependent enzyme [Caldilinea sp. CFX5]
MKGGVLHNRFGAGDGLPRQFNFTQLTVKVALSAEQPHQRAQFQGAVGVGKLRFGIDYPVGNPSLRLHLPTGETLTELTVNHVTNTLAVAAQELMKIGMAQITASEAALTAYALQQLQTIPGLTLYGETDWRRNTSPSARMLSHFSASECSAAASQRSCAVNQSIPSVFLLSVFSLWTTSKD